MKTRIKLEYIKWHITTTQRNMITNSDILVIKTDMLSYK
jgi:hypothetical protein